jgi:hypothetical protein
MLVKSLRAVGGIFALMLISSVYSALRYPATSNNSTIIPLSETMLYFEPEMINIKPNESFTIKVNIKNLHEELWGFEVGLKFNIAILEYQGVEYPAWQFVSGKIGWLFWVATLSPQLEDQTLMTLTFKAKSEGETQLTFYTHKLATAKYIDRIYSYVGWPIEHITSVAVIVSNA